MMRTIREIVDAAGGTKVVAAALGVSIHAIYMWPRIGVPDRHWPTIIPMAKSNAEEMYWANVEARSRFNVLPEVVEVKS